MRALNVERQKQMVADTNKLLKLAKELNDEVAAANTGSFTPDQLRKIGEIEKLAHSVRERMAAGSAMPDPSCRSPDGLFTIESRDAPQVPAVVDADGNRQQMRSGTLVTIKRGSFGKASVSAWGSTGMESAISSARASGTLPQRTSPDRAAVDRNLPADVSFARGRRPRNPAQAPAEDLFPDLGRGP